MKNELLLSADGSDLLSYSYIPISIFFDLTLNSEKGRGGGFLFEGKVFPAGDWIYVFKAWILFISSIHMLFFYIKQKILYLVYWEVYNW